jgi:peptide/nickel transport system permease protein
MADKDNTRKSNFLLDALKPLLGMRSKTLSLMEEEQVQSPGRTILREFFRRKLTILGLIGFFTILIASVILPFFFPLDLSDHDTGQFNQPPGLNMMSVPRALRGNISMISPGPGYGVGLSNDNMLYTWGAMIGNSEPLRNPPLLHAPAVHISAGQGHALAVTDDGYVYIWGDENIVFLLHHIPWHIQGTVTTAAAGRRMSVALTDQGRPYAWGNMGDMANIALHRFPMTAHGVQVEMNTLTAGIRTDNGRLYILMPTSREFRYVPDEIQGRIIDFAMGETTAAALLDDNTVVVWGAAGEARDTIPTHIQGRVVSLMGGREHYTVLLDNGHVYSWGENTHGRAVAPTITNATQIFVGTDHNYALLSDGSVVTWGLRGFIFGTDGRGRDIFSRLWSAGRYSLLIGAVAVIVSGLIGLFLGGLSGYYGGKVDMFLMRFAEAVGSLPFLPIALILQWRFRDFFGPVGGMVFLMVVLGLLTWPGLMRLVRGQFLQARESEYVTAARTLGVRQYLIIFKHIFPNVASVAIVSLTLSLASSMLTETTLSFIGFGITEPTPTWGNMLTGANNSIVLREQWWRWVFPAVALVTTAMSINLIGDGLREATDPKAQGR